MNPNRRQLLAGVLILLLLVVPACHAGGLRLSPLFGDNACVQTQRPVRIWGWSSAGDKITVTLGKGAARATAAEDGRWQCELPPVPVGGPYGLVVRDAAGDEVRSQNILAGEVWLASGQSNMHFPVSKTKAAATDMPAANRPALRLFRNEVVPSYTPSKEPNGKWVVCTSETVKEFSGVAYFFGRKLNQELNVPVGLIQTSLGGTPIEGWLPPEIWKTSPELEKIRQAQADRADKHKRKRFEAVHQAWEKRGKPADKEPAKPDYGEVDQNDPSVCFNSGIAPMAGYAIAGFLWYQGEWNVSHAADYSIQLPLLITQWRQLWREGDIPFYVVQLPAIGKTPGGPVEPKSDWARLREAQLSALTLPNTGIAIIIDTGGELHPPEKREVGERLARQALAKTYGRKIDADGPMLRKTSPGDGALRLDFSHARGLVLRPVSGQTGFVISGADRKYYPAQARVEGDAVILSNPSVSNPVQARYLWANNPAATLFNGAGLPASPFRTDDWDVFDVAFSTK